MTFYHSTTRQKQGQNIALLFQLPLSLVSSTFLGTLYWFSFSVSTWAVLYTSSMFRLHRVSYTSNPSTRSGPVAVQRLYQFQNNCCYFSSVSYKQTKMNVVLAWIYKKGPLVPSGGNTQLINFNSRFWCLEREVLFERTAFPNHQWFHQLKSPDLVNKSSQICYLHVKLHNNCGKLLYILEICWWFRC
jgi:hypothetical protein